MRKTLTAFTSVLLSVCLFYTLPTAQLQSKKINLSNGKRDAKTPLQVLVARSPDASKADVNSKEFAPPTKEEADNFLSGKDKKASTALAFRKFRKMLLDQGVSFEPNLLLENNWKERFKNQLSSVKEMQVSKRFVGGKIKGVIIANTLYLPKETEFSEDTVILANRIVFEGKDVLIKGNHGIAIFSLEDTYLTEPISGTAAAQRYSSPVNSPEFENEFFARNRILKHTEEELKPVDGRITVDANEIVRTHQNIGKIVIVKDKLIVPAGMITVEAGSNGKRQKNNQIKQTDEQFSPLDSVNEQTGNKGAPGSFPTNPKGARGDDGKDGTAGGEDGSCSGGTNDVNGKDGENAKDGKAGDTGDSADGDAGTGDVGPPIILSISGTDNAYTFTSRGGEGGDGQAGAFGGDGGDGGKGKKGGNGTTCGCSVGNGGKSGNNGKGGDAGSGGNGGKAGDGGPGGIIHITYPAGVNTPNIIAQSFGGLGGLPGLPGQPGLPGKGLAGTNGGSAGYQSCGNYGSSGGFGETGDDGSVENIAQPGFPGAEGSPGPDPVIGPESGGGGLGGGYCIPYYWVLYYSWDGGETWHEMQDWNDGCW